jgi:hypothetical protein
MKLIWTMMQLSVVLGFLVFINHLDNETERDFGVCTE